MKKSILQLTLLPAAFALASGAAHAQWYAGFELGEAETDQAVTFDLPPDTATDDSSDIAWKLFGGYNFSPMFALEFGYTDLGDDYTTSNILGDSEETQMDVTSLYATLIGRVQIDDQVRFFGRLGMGLWDVELSYDEPSFSSADSDRDLDLVVGLGFEWTYADNLALRFEWEQFQNVGDEVKTAMPASTGTDLELNGQDINMFGLAVVYRFARH